MAKARIYELAKKIGRSNKELTDALEALGVKGKTHSSSIDDETANRVMEYFLGLGADELFSGPLDTELGDYDETEDEEIETEKEAEESPVAVAMVKSKGEVLAEAPDEAKEPAAPVKEKEREQKKPIIAIPESAIKIEKALRQVKPQEPEVEIPAPDEPAEAAVTTAVPLKPAKKEKKKEKARQPQQPQQPAQPQRRPGKRGMETRLADLVQDDLDDLTGADRFKNAAVEPVDKAKPDLQRAFQAIRKLDQGRPAGGPPRGVTAPRGKRRGAPAAGGRPGPQSYQQRSAPKPVHPSGTALRKKAYKFTEGMTVKEFAELIAVKSSEIIKQFMGMGYAPNINQPVDMDAAMLIAENLGIKLEVSEPEEVFDVEAVQDAPESLLTRSPIVTIMGHVDHGKTSLLDAIRETKVTEGEAGGITQHIGAYKVQLKGREITFLDTPGHEAFTALRARGASVTDIVVLIVAADDGVKPQTVEAIDHAKAAGVPIMVAINKIDKPGSDPTRVRQELSEHGIISEDWGGQNIFAEISAKQRIGIEGLLELVLLQADMLELKANPDRMAAGVIIESRLDKGRGPVATVLVQHGTLKIGDSFLAGMNTGKVKALYDDMGKKIKSATPSTPVEVIGFSEVPNAGEVFVVMEDEKKARAIATARYGRQKTAAQVGKRKLTLDELYSKIAAGEVKDLNIVIKGDVQGSVEAIRESMEQIKHAEVQVRVIHSAVGGINESDVMLASASNAIIIGFNVRPELKAASLAEQEGVDIELYNVIYEAIDDVKKALEGMLKPTIKEKILGHAEVREIFVASRIGTIAGCMVVDGVMQRNCDGVRVIRNSIVVYTGRLGSLKRFKEDAKEVATGYECGIMIENFNDVKVGDIFEDYVNEEIAGKL